MAKKLIMKKQTEKDVINELGFGYADLMDIFDVSKQRAFAYLKGEGKPSTENLQRVAIQCVGEMPGLLANRMLTIRGEAIPCVCLEKIGDGGSCPKHGATVAVPLAVTAEAG